MNIAVAPTAEQNAVGASIAAPSRVAARTLYMDVLRALASFCVVLIHIMGTALSAVAFASTNWFVAVTLDSLARWSVPIFLMLSGALVLGYRQKYSTATFFRKRFMKVLLPFAAWSAIYLAWQQSIGDLRLSLSARGIRDVLSHTVSSPAMYHLWFFYAILGLYLVTPILGLVVTGSKRTAWWLVALCLVHNMALPLITAFGHVTFDIDFVSQIPAQFVDYFVLGWLLKDLTFGWRSQLVAYVAGLAGLAVTIVGTVWLSLPAHQTATLFFEYESFNCLAVSVALFVLAKSIDWSWLRRVRPALALVRALAGASLGIYLIHLLVLYFVTVNTGWSAGSLSFVLFAAPVVYAIAAVVVIVLRKIPLLSLLVP